MHLFSFNYSLGHYSNHHMSDSNIVNDQIEFESSISQHQIRASSDTESDKLTAMNSPYSGNILIL